MTVAQLIEKLKNFDPEANVVEYRDESAGDAAKYVVYDVDDDGDGNAKIVASCVAYL